MSGFTTRLAAVCDRLNLEGARYVLVDARAGQLWGVIRATRDIHLLIEATVVNATRVLTALEGLGVGVATEGLGEVVAARVATCLGEISRVDILTVAGGVGYEQAAADASTFLLEGVPVPTASLDHLIAAFERGQPSDPQGLELLREIRRLNGL